MTAARRLEVLVIAPSVVSRTYFEGEDTPFAGWDVRQTPFPVESVFDPRALLRLARLMASRRFDLVIAYEYRRAFVASLFSALLRRRTLHFNVGFNLSARPILTGLRPLDALVGRIFRRNAVFVVHSRHEIALFRDLHGIPEDRFYFAHWGFDAPGLGADRFAGRPRPYACCIGRNNRDFETFARAVRLAGIDGVIVAPGYLDLSHLRGDGVEVLHDLSMEDCASCVAHAAASVTPLKSDDRGAGHITLVLGMHLGTPQIVTDAQAVRDYALPDRTALMVPLGDAEAVAEALARVLQQDPAVAAITRQAQDYARTFLSHGYATGRVAQVLRAALDGRPIAQIDEAWARRMREL
jgi:glycosyltransferase involved in cell wall biosynthesis